ncbi:hypothetical protein QAD02_002191 [Eretmocerus hayati]|uniref:Uncharacterized protein n=1 Tax=Eretmocerus hayati TaxID=131215 RepID=A0ACC2NL30_9HYME|nr:hypothetical protein QAD02_002191 [Eretmocerus hayati]
MNHARRMVIVPEETLSRLRISVPTATAVSASTADSTPANVTHDSMQTVGGEASSRLDSEMFELMNSKDITDEREKCVKYLQILRRYLYFKDKERHSEFMSRLDGDDESDASAIARLTEDRIIENLPVAHAEHARSLLRHWLSFEPDRFKWNDKGNVIIDGTVVPQSNIVELLAHVVKKSGRTNKPPVGQLEFAKFIGTSATPTRSEKRSEMSELPNLLLSTSYALNKSNTKRLCIGLESDNGLYRRVIKFHSSGKPLTLNAADWQFLKDHFDGINNYFRNHQAFNDEFGKCNKIYLQNHDLTFATTYGTRTILIDERPTYQERKLDEFKMGPPNSKNYQKLENDKDKLIEKDSKKCVWVQKKSYTKNPPDSKNSSTNTGYKKF